MTTASPSDDLVGYFFMRSPSLPALIDPVTLKTTGQYVLPVAPTGQSVWSDPNYTSQQTSTGPLSLPNVVYEMIDPNGVHYVNTNPSGNLEWEQFMVSTAAPFKRSQMDYQAGSLPAGTYALHVTGLDIDNLAALHFDFALLGELCDGTNCIPPPPFFPPPPPSSPSYPTQGTGTLGYWKNHPNAWPMGDIVMGDSTYTETQALAILGTAPKGNVTYTLAQQLIAAMLNVVPKLGNDSSCIQTIINDANFWMAAYGQKHAPNQPPSSTNATLSNISGSSPLWQVGQNGLPSASFMQTTLDNYNNGLMCAPHRK